MQRTGLRCLPKEATGPWVWVYLDGGGGGDSSKEAMYVRSGFLTEDIWRVGVPCRTRHRGIAEEGSAIVYTGWKVYRSACEWGWKHLDGGVSPKMELQSCLQAGKSSTESLVSVDGCTSTELTEGCLATHTTRHDLWESAGPTRMTLWPSFLGVRHARWSLKNTPSFTRDIGWLNMLCTHRI